MWKYKVKTFEMFGNQAGDAVENWLNTLTMEGVDVEVESMLPITLGFAGGESGPGLLVVVIVSEKEG